MRLAVALFRLLVLSMILVRETVLASLRIAWDVLTPRSYRAPSIVAVPVAETWREASGRLPGPGELALAASLITVTPGSLVVDIDVERHTLYVHSMFSRDPDAERREILALYVRNLARLLR